MTLSYQTDAGSITRAVSTYLIAGTQTPIDPGAVTFTVQKPDGTTATPTTVHESVGVYHADIDTTNGNQAGLYGGVWTVKIVSTAPAADVRDVSFYVRSLGF